MAKRSYAKTTFSVRLSQQALSELQQRASEDRKTVGAVIRSLVAAYIEERDGEDILGNMESRIIATIERAERQRARQRRQIELTLLEVDYLRREMDYRYMKRLGPNEDPVSIFRRSDKSYFGWLQKVFKKRLDLLCNAVTEPVLFLEEVREDPEEPRPGGPMPDALAPNTSGSSDLPADTVSKPAAAVNGARGLTEKSLAVETGLSVPAPKPTGVVTTDVNAPAIR